MKCSLQCTNCGIMGQNQSHVAKYKTAKFAFYQKMSKYVHFCFHQKQNICVSSYLYFKLIFALSISFLCIFWFERNYIIDGETQFFLIKASFFIILVF